MPLFQVLDLRGRWYVPMAVPLFFENLKKVFSPNLEPMVRNVFVLFYTYVACFLYFIKFRDHSSKNYNLADLTWIKQIYKSPIVHQPSPFKCKHIFGPCTSCYSLLWGTSFVSFISNLLNYSANPLLVAELRSLTTLMQINLFFILDVDNLVFAS